MLKKLVFTILCLSSVFSFSQQVNLNQYKYVIVPNRFDFLKEADQYKANSLTRFLFKKYGFTTFLDNEIYPEDLANNKCLALTATVVDKSSAFSTATLIELKDCFNKVVYATKKERSKIKNYKKSFQDAIRKSFKSIKNLNYKYQPKKSVAFKKDNSWKEKDTIVNVPFIKKKKDVPAIKNPKVKTVKAATVKLDKNILYAQPIKNGFQIVNITPKVVFKVLKSSKKDLYFIKNKNGILYKLGDSWIAEYYENDILIQKKYNIKF